jgi:hypothetical protein
MVISLTYSLSFFLYKHIIIHLSFFLPLSLFHLYCIYSLFLYTHSSISLTLLSLLSSISTLFFLLTLLSLHSSIHSRLFSSLCSWSGQLSLWHTASHETTSHSYDTFSFTQLRSLQAHGCIGRLLYSIFAFFPSICHHVLFTSVFVYSSFRYQIYLLFSPLIASVQSVRRLKKWQSTIRMNILISFIALRLKTCWKCRNSNTNVCAG